MHYAAQGGVILNQSLFENTKLAAYFLWERTSSDNTLSLWNCVEDIACCLEQNGLLAPEKIVDILNLGKYDLKYIQFVRHIAYRIYIYTNRDDKLANWYCAESLLDNGELRSAVCKMAAIYSQEKHTANGLSELRSGQVKNYYDSQGREWR
jgi:hypothetical protein